jgi:hypothetical protein
LSLLCSLKKTKALDLCFDFKLLFSTSLKKKKKKKKRKSYYEFMFSFLALQVCSNMVASAQTQLPKSALQSVLYDSCSALVTSLYLTCRTMDEMTSRAAAAARQGGASQSGQSFTRSLNKTFFSNLFQT